jgi:8-amino-7-oxononanoate synthase
VPADLSTIEAELADLSEAGLRRRMRPIDSPQGRLLQVDGRTALNFSSNNYLGLADEPFLSAAAERARDQGFGSGASRLIAGSLSIHRQLERSLADWTGAPAALLFNSGYQANVGVLSALAGRGDVIFSDALNHASIIDGCRLSRATVEVYPHLDLEALARRLAAHPEARRRLLVTDSVFSMDGDVAPLPALVDLARANDALLIVDDAHALGVMGADGAGLAAGLDVDVRIATLGKALGTFGAFAAAAAPVIDLLVQRARSFVFTTALPVPVAAAADAAVSYCRGPEGIARRQELARACARFHAGLIGLGFPAPPSPRHIVPLQVRDGDPRRAMEASEALLSRGIFAQGIRPPTVPPGTARLRFSLMATHREEDIDAALAGLGELRPLFL